MSTSSLLISIALWTKKYIWLYLMALKTQDLVTTGNSKRLFMNSNRLGNNGRSACMKF